MVVRHSGFHLDCIHREFSAKGEMRCPNCRNVETSQWPFPNSPRPSNELNVDGLLNRGDRIDPEAPQFQSEGFGRGLAYAVLDSPTEGLGYYASLTNQPYPYSTTLAEGHVGWSSNQPQFQFGGFSRGDAAAAAAACAWRKEVGCYIKSNCTYILTSPRIEKANGQLSDQQPNGPGEKRFKGDVARKQIILPVTLTRPLTCTVTFAYEQSFTSFLNSGGSLTNPRHHPSLEVPAISSTNPPYAYSEPSVSSTRGLTSHGSLMTQPYRDSATRAELRSQNLNAYILGARNQGREPATG
ncbi:hypothetical protein HanXRQr2_Chr09g0374431 [Helianthus annuus]|uniref:Zinc finger, RING/FYVE/PHD-type n=1 Tax=Helianthus annuus TaxID=4232 RepID=A0A9K3I4Q1_HELAN|nr:hypothetical protein HanXRQr2_Chr09g0374431 [Helianthus annuus]